jgi:hypothetical protein
MTGSVSRETLRALAQRFPLNLSAANLSFIRTYVAAATKWPARTSSPPPRPPSAGLGPRRPFGRLRTGGNVEPWLLCRMSRLQIDAVDRRFSRQLQEWMIHRMSNITPTIWWRLLHKSGNLRSIRHSRPASPAIIDLLPAAPGARDGPPAQPSQWPCA